MQILKNLFESFIWNIMENFWKENYDNGINIIYKLLINLIEDNIDIESLFLVQYKYKNQLIRYF